MDLSKYYSEILQHPNINREEEYTLFVKYYDKTTPEKEKEAIKSKIVASNLRFVFKQAKFSSRREPGAFEDLIAAGNEGLVVGFEKYKPSKEVRFLSYAGWWIQQRILKEMSKWRIVSLPIWKQQLASRIVKAIDNKEDITLTELIEMFGAEGVPEKDIRELYSTRYLTYYIDDLPEEDFEIDPIGTEVQQRLDDEKMWKTVSSLPSPHREVIARIFGFEDGKEQSITQIAKALRLPKENINNIKAEALEMLREKMLG